MIKARFEEGILTLNGKHWSGTDEKTNALADFLNTAVEAEIKLADVFTAAPLAGYDSPAEPSMEYAIAKWTVDNFEGEITEKSELPLLEEDVIY